MRVLSLDTTTREGSVALVDDGRVVDERIGDRSRTHAERLPAELLAPLAARGWALPDIDLFAVAAGPGSFTGLRIGIATIQGLALVQQRPVVAVSALSALGQIGSLGAHPGELVGAWIDAHRREVFTALYRVGGAEPFEPDRLIEIEGPMVGEPTATLRRWDASVSGGPATIIGDGAALYADAIGNASAPAYRLLRDVPPLAGAIGRMALVLARSGTRPGPAGVQPLYVRRPDAEIARESAHHKGHQG